MPEEIERRKKKEGIPPVPESRTPWQEIYRSGVGQLDGGAVMESALKYRGVAAETPATTTSKRSRMVEGELPVKPPKPS